MQHPNSKKYACREEYVNEHVKKILVYQNLYQSMLTITRTEIPTLCIRKRGENLIHTFSIGGKLAEFFPAPAPGTLTQLQKPASSTESLSISPSTYKQHQNHKSKVGEEIEGNKKKQI